MYRLKKRLIETVLFVATVAVTTYASVALASGL